MHHTRRPWLWMALLGCLSAVLTAPALAALAPPTTLTTSPLTPSKYQISWTPPSQATSSTVTLMKDNQVFRIRTSGNVITPIFPMSGTWSIMVTSRNAVDESAPLASELSVMIPAPTQVPTGVTVQNFDQRANLRWTSMGDGYTMRISWTDPVTSQPQVLLSKGTFLALRGLLNDQLYTINLAWQNSSGIGPATQVAIAPVSSRISTTVNPTVTPLSATSTQLSWSATPGATFYAIYTGTVNDYLTLRHQGLPRIVTSPSVLLTDVSDQHYAFVLAGNMNGLGPAPVNGTQLAVLSGVTDAPTLTLSPGPDSLTASWTSVPGATTYALFYMPTPFVQGSATRLNNVTSPYTVTQLTNGQPYGMAVLGANSAGDGPLSAIVTDTPAAPYLGYQAVGVDLTSGPIYRGAGIELDNGLVFFPSSSKQSNQANAAYLFNPATEVWTAAAAFPVGSYYDANAGDPHRMVKLNDGRVLAVSNPRLGPPAVYDPATNTWTPTGPIMPPNAGPNDTHVIVPAYDFALAVLPDGRVLLSGGRMVTRIDTIPVGKAWIYSPATNQWTEAAPMLGDARYGHAMIRLLNGKILMVGGTNGADYGAAYYATTGTCQYPLPDGSCVYATPSTQIYDPDTNTWSASGEMINKRYAHTLSLLPNGDVLAFGGFVTGGGGLDGIGTYTAERYNAASGSWSAVGSMPMVQANANVDNPGNIAIRYRGPVVKALPNGQVVWLSDKGPFHEDMGIPEELTFVMFDPSTNLWTQSAAASSHSPFQCDYVELWPGFGYCQNGEDHGSVLTVLSDGKVLVTGGPNVPRLYN